MLPPGADAVMIGGPRRKADRGSFAIPDTVGHGSLPAALTTQEVAALMDAHLQDHYALYGNDTGVRSANTYGWYTEGLPGANRFVMNSTS